MDVRTLVSHSKDTGVEWPVRRQFQSDGANVHERCSLLRRLKKSQWPRRFATKPTAYLSVWEEQLRSRELGHFSM